jgi:5-methylthioadenosine/S-adenosylhomocysteine deaminase
MELVDLIITGGLLLTLDDKDRIYYPGAVAIAGDEIRAAGELDKVLKSYQGHQIIDAKESLLMPGLVNAHTHGPMVYFRGMADDLPLKEWLERHIWPAEARLVRPKFIRDAIQLACAELIRSGTTTFNDMYFFEDVEAEIVKEIGMRACIGKALFNFPGPDGKTAIGRLRAAERFIKHWLKDPLIRPAAAPHSVYTCSGELLISAKRLSEEFDIPYHIHLSETQSEVEEIKSRQGMRPVEYLARLGVLGPRFVGVHGVWLAPEELNILKEHGCGLVHCPTSNMKLASGAAPIVQTLKKGIKLGLGSDGAASNNSLDLFSELKAAALLAKLREGDPTALPARTVVRMATRGGAELLGLGSLIGSLEPNKKADILILNLNQPHLQPLYDPYSHLVYAARGSDVETVIINGRLVMDHRRLLTIDEDLVLKKAKKFRRYKG